MLSFGAHPLQEKCRKLLGASPWFKSRVSILKYHDKKYIELRNKVQSVEHTISALMSLKLLGDPCTFATIPAAEHKSNRRGMRGYRGARGISAKTTWDWVSSVVVVLGSC